MSDDKAERLRRYGDRAHTQLLMAKNRMFGKMSGVYDKNTLPVKVVLGISGAGKSRSLIGRVKEARQEERETHVFLCRESHVFRGRPNIAEKGVMGCREPGLVCGVDHFVTTEEAIELLAAAGEGALTAFDEAFWFGAELAEAWLEAARRGVEVIVVMPSDAQKKILARGRLEFENFVMRCQRCDEAEATRRFVVYGKNETYSTCAPCAAKIKKQVKAQVLDMLEAQRPYPGEKRIYQPVLFCPGGEWEVLRADSPRRVELIAATVKELGFLDTGRDPDLRNRPTYLDVGCNTGYFCREMARLNFNATGVDLVLEDIEVARLIDGYFEQTFSTFVHEDAFLYLERTRKEKVDVVSALSTIQWLMIQKDVEHGMKCLEYLFAKTRRLCVLEMGYSEEEHYKEQLGVKIDRYWVLRVMEELGGFDRVQCLGSGEYGIKRDLFLGFRDGEGSAGPDRAGADGVTGAKRKAGEKCSRGAGECGE